MNWFIDCITKNYANFNGRARRKEYWMYVLFNCLLGIALNFIALIFGSISHSLLSVMVFVQCIISLALIIPGLAVTVRRLHDINKSGWWILIGLIPLIGAIVLFVFACLDSTPGSNQYGENPKGL
ncbi:MULTISPECIES: DUF805 domain-containing protein [unclassified Gilliamella]|jgi:uncharacterized membrane protein YhaH (DUF805 family)|uniref:DUF805 domain-containing protein n=1 Tax=unclassified Gilliamella TaxID=2685620 RepID=UPI00080E473D|nr:DUF805 domain-containing protein [Gilliamella apicola]OCG14837.1 hypothetical protein A9G47_02900 [Gilliamella apicola]OCG57663.1 hypothetical protein A9G40_12080 [Gilliamella apicola]OCG71680.1 hypothetical protein A9G41_02460 [Gilliamella apicola]